MGVPRGQKVGVKPLEQPSSYSSRENPAVQRWGVFKAQILAGLSFLERVTIPSYIKYSWKLIFLNRQDIDQTQNRAGSDHWGYCL